MKLDSKLIRFLIHSTMELVEEIISIIAMEITMEILADQIIRPVHQTRLTIKTETHSGKIL